MSTDYSNEALPENSEFSSHFWICTYPFVQTSLFVVRSRQVTQTRPVDLTFYDADGNCINEVTLDFSPAESSIVELEDFLASCKLESGLKHGHLQVRHGPGAKCLCRLHTREGACVQGEPALVTNRKGAFVPVVFGTDRQSMLVLVNYEKKVATLRCRLFCGKRTPETTCVVPGLGARILSASAVFPEFVPQEGFGQVQGYFRVTSLEECQCGVQLVETVVSGTDGGIFGSIS